MFTSGTEEWESALVKSYDELGQMIQSTTNQNDMKFLTSYEYDETGKVTKTTERTENGTEWTSET